MKNNLIYLALINLIISSCQDNLSPENDYLVESSLKNNGVTIDSNSINSISKEDALRIIKPLTDRYPDRWVDISDNIIPAKSLIGYNALGIKRDGDSPATFEAPDYDSWLAVIGPDGTVNGGQELLHIFINSSNGDFSEIRINGRAIVDWDTSRNVYVTHETDNTRLMNKILPNTRSSNPTQWAVILSGGANSSNNYDRYWNDCQYVYIALTQELGFPTNHIFCLVSDGLDPAFDRKIGPNTYDSSPVDFDNDGYIDIAYSASKTNLATVFSYLGSVVTDGDEVLLFVTDHGEEGGLIDLWNGETLTPLELNTELNKLGHSVMIDVVMGQCFSGACIPSLSANNRTIVTAVNGYEYSHANTVYGGYDYFLRYWTDGIYSATPSVSGQHSNGDGYLSLFELFHYAKSNPQASAGTEHPLRSSTPTLLIWGHDLELNSFIPFIVGGNYASTYVSTDYTLYGLPSSLTPSWQCSNNLTIDSSNSSSASISGYNLQTSQYVSLGALLSATFTDLGENWSVDKEILSVWKPGYYIGYNHILGTNYGCYFLEDYPSIGTYPGTYGYQWFLSNSTWQIVSQNGASVNILEMPYQGSIYLSVAFHDPFGGEIYVSDQVH